MLHFLPSDLGQVLIDGQVALRPLQWLARPNSDALRPAPRRTSTASTAAALVEIDEARPNAARGCSI
jgi:hypothetical protein